MESLFIQLMMMDTFCKIAPRDCTVKNVKLFQLIII